MRSVNAIVGESNDADLNDIRGGHVKRSHVIEAIRTAAAGPVKEDAVGAGTGTSAFGWKGGIGTASRRIPMHEEIWTVGVLVQRNPTTAEDDSRSPACPLGASAASA